MITLQNINTKCKDFLSRGKNEILLDITERDFETDAMEKILKAYSPNYSLSYFRNCGRYFVEVVFEV